MQVASVLKSKWCGQAEVGAAVALTAEKCLFCSGWFSLSNVWTIWSAKLRVCCIYVYGELQLLI